MIYAFLFVSLTCLSLFLFYFISGISFFNFHSLSGLMPIKYHIAQTFLEGRYPYFNELLGGGVPFHTGIGMLDPFLISHVFIADPHKAMLLSSFLALVCAGMGMYLFLRKLDLNQTASVMGACLYSANPFFSATSHESPFMNPPVFLPYIFLFRNSYLAGFFLALTFLAGNIESYIFIVFFYVIARVIMNDPFIKTVGLSLVFCSIDLIPTFWTWIHSTRDPGYLIQYLVHFSISALFAVIFVRRVKSYKIPLLVNASIIGLFFVGWDGHSIFNYIHRDTFIFYIQPPAYLLTPLMFPLFIMGLIGTPNRLRVLGYFGVMIALFPYTYVPNLNHYLLGMNEIAYPRIMFEFFFIQTILISYAFGHLSKRSSRRKIYYGIAFLIVLETVCFWNIHTFQNDDHRVITQSFPETEYFKKIKGTVQIRNKEINQRRFYDERRPLDLAGNMPLFWGVKTLDAWTLNIRPEIKEADPDYIYSDSAVMDPNYDQVLKGTRYFIYRRQASKL